MEIIEKVVTKVVRYIEFDGIRFYPDKKGYWLGTNPITKKPIRLHKYVWEKYNGPIPKGYQVHHKDFNPDNNEIENLELLPKSEHLSYHSNLQDKTWARENLLKNAVPAAAAWHASEEGHKWHSEHGKRTMEARMEKKVAKTCQFCGKEYEVPEPLAENSRFCSNNCKSAWRRKAGLDDIEVACELCGKHYFTNKYSRKRFCSPKCRRTALYGSKSDASNRKVSGDDVIPD